LGFVSYAQPVDVVDQFYGCFRFKLLLTESTNASFLIQQSISVSNKHQAPKTLMDAVFMEPVILKIVRSMTLILSSLTLVVIMAQSAGLDGMVLAGWVVKMPAFSDFLAICQLDDLLLSVSISIV